jgi:hypothetical protein
MTYVNRFVYDLVKTLTFLTDHYGSKPGLTNKFLMKFPNVEFKEKVLGRTKRLLSFDKTGVRIENDQSNNSAIVTAVKFLRSCCLVTIVGYTCRHTD